MLRYLSGIKTSTLKDGTDGCAGWSATPGFPGCGNLSDVFPTISILCSNDLASKALLSTLCFKRLYIEDLLHFFIFFLMFVNF